MVDRLKIALFIFEAAIAYRVCCITIMWPPLQRITNVLRPVSMHDCTPNQSFSDWLIDGAVWLPTARLWLYYPQLQTPPVNTHSLIPGLLQLFGFKRAKSTVESRLKIWNALWFVRPGLRNFEIYKQKYADLIGQKYKSRIFVNFCSHSLIMKKIWISTERISVLHLLSYLPVGDSDSLHQRHLGMTTCTFTYRR